jgi:hypothetical protein
MRTDEVTINAKGLSSPGPKMMVESAVATRKIKWIRVIVSAGPVVKELTEYFESLSASHIEVDELGDECHVIANLTPRRE